jgi:hypothetical protein
LPDQQAKNFDIQQLRILFLRVFQMREFIGFWTSEEFVWVHLSLMALGPAAPMMFVWLS